MAFGALKGTVLSVAANSITATTSATGSQAVVAGDLIYAVIAEQASATVTACGDNLGNTYSPTSAAADAGTICTGRAYWSRVTNAGTLTSVNFTCTGSANNVVALAAVIEGPFAASPLDANPANTVNDNTTPYAGPPTGTLAQASEVVLCWVVHNGAPTFTATAPNVITTQLPTATILKLAIGRQVVAATTTVTPAWTASAVPTQSCYGTTSFKADSFKTLTADVSSYTTAGQTALVKKNSLVTAATSSYAVAGQAAGFTYVAAGPSEQVLGGGFVPFGSAPWGGAQVLAQEYSLTADAGSYAVTGQAATLRQGHVVVASASSYSVAGQAATLRQANVLTAATVGYSVSGQAATAKHGSLVTASAGSYAVTGQAAAFVQGSNIIAAAGAYAITGQPATLRHTRLLAAGAGAYAVTGNAAGFAYEAADAYVITGLPGVYAVTGQAATVRYASLLTAAAGSYAVAGQAATLRQTSVVPAAAGAYAVTGQAAGLRTASVLVASAGSYAISGQPATLRQGHAVAAQAGAYAVSGQSATLAKGRSLAASAGAYAVTGQAASLTWQAVGAYVLAGQAGAYAVTGQPATLLTASVLVAASGSYSVTGQTATLHYEALGPPVEPPIFGGGVSKPLVRRELVARIESTQQPQFARLVGGVSVPAKVRSREQAQANDAQLGLLVIGELATRQTQMVREGVLWQAMLGSAYADQDRQNGNGELQLILDMNIKSGLERTQVPQYTGEPMAKIFVASDPAWSKKKAA